MVGTSLLAFAEGVMLWVRASRDDCLNQAIALKTLRGG